MIVTPLEFLAFMLLVTATAGTIRYISRRRYVARLRALADEWKMHFSADDRFRLTPRIATRLGIPGAAGIRVADLLYALEHDHYRYIFAAEYTTGVLRTKTSVRRIATFTEPKDAAATADGDGAANNAELEFAPESLPLVEQYRELLQRRQGEKK